METAELVLLLVVVVLSDDDVDGGDGGDGGGDGNGGFENVLAQFYRKSLHFYRNVGTV